MQRSGYQQGRPEEAAGTVSLLQTERKAAKRAAERRYKNVTEIKGKDEMKRKG